jgi:hypothetical protein
MPDGVAIAAYLPREDVRDALISALADTIEDLPHGVTFSPRPGEKAASRDSHPFDDRLRPRRLRLKRGGQAPFALPALRVLFAERMNTRDRKRGNIEREG